MTWYGDSPGSIKNQVGQSVSLIRDLILEEDDLRAANEFRYLVAFTSPHTTREERERLIIRDSEEPGEVFEQIFRGIEFLLPILAKRAGIFTYVPGESKPWDDGEEEKDPESEKPPTLGGETVIPSDQAKEEA